MLVNLFAQARYVVRAPARVMYSSLHALALLWSATVLYGCGEMHCRAGGCVGDHLYLAIEPSGSKLEPGSYTVTIDTNVGMMECVIAVDPSITGGISGTCDRDIASEAAPCVVGHDLTQWSDGQCRALSVILQYSPDRIDFRYENGPLSHLAVRVDRNGMTLLDTSMKPNYKDFSQPDECGGIHCAQADIRLELP